MVKHPLDTDKLKDFDLLEFPVTFALKVIMTSEADNKKNIEDLNKILKKTAVTLQEPWTFTESRNGNYISYTGVVLVKTKSQMYILYGELSTHPNVKYAL